MAARPRKYIDRWETWHSGEGGGGGECFPYRSFSALNPPALFPFFFSRRVGDSGAGRNECLARPILELRNQLDAGHPHMDLHGHVAALGHHHEPVVAQVK